MLALEARNLKFSYPDGQQALDGVNLQIRQGEFLALIGANGSGKTTLFQHFNGLLQAGAGEVYLFGQPIGRLRDEEIFQTVGLVFQDPNDQLFAARVYEDVAYAPTNLNLPSAEIHSRVREALELMECWDLKDRPIRSLSYGQKKRVAIAGILALKPKVLVLDEPTAGLDPRSSCRLLRLLQEIQSRSDLTVIISTHEVDYVPIYCQRVYVLKKGQVQLEGTPAEVFKRREEIRKADLRLPRIGHLLEILQNKDGVSVAAESALTISAARKQLLKLIRRA